MTPVIQLLWVGEWLIPSLSIGTELLSRQTRLLKVKQYLHLYVGPKFFHQVIHPRVEVLKCNQCVPGLTLQISS